MNSLFSDESEFTFEEFKWKGEKLKYRLFQPENFAKESSFSLVLTLHGSSLRGSDNRAQLKENRGPMELKRYIKKNKINAMIVSPQCPSGERWVETPWYGDDHTVLKRS